MSYDEVDPELIAVINQRMELLRTLRTPRDKRDLTAELDLSRSTVNRAVRQLESLGLVTRDGEYRLTVAGRLVVEVFGDFAERLGDVVRVEGLLSALPAGAPMGLPMVRNATVYRPTGPGPDDAVTSAVAAMEPAVRVRALLPRVNRSHTLEKLRVVAVEKEVPATLVLSEQLARHLRDERPRWVTDLGDAEECDLLVADSLPYTVWVVRQADAVHAGLIVYDGDGAVQGYVENDTSQAYAWAESVFGEYREAATPFSAAWDDGARSDVE